MENKVFNISINKINSNKYITNIDFKKIMILHSRGVLVRNTIPDNSNLSSYKIENVNNTIGSVVKFDSEKMTVEVNFRKEIENIEKYELTTNILLDPNNNKVRKVSFSLIKK